ESRDGAIVGQAVDNFGKVTNAHRRTVDVAHHHIGQGLGRVIFKVELDERFGRARDQKAAGEMHMLGGECLANIAGGHAQSGHAIEIDLDANRARAASADLILADAVDRLQTLENGVVGVLVELLQSAIALERNPQYGAGASFDLGHHRLVGVVGELAQYLVDLGLNLVEGNVDVLVKLEGDNHVRHARAGT